MARKDRAERKPLPRMPDMFRKQAEEAIERHRQRGWVPDVIQGSSGGWFCPYAKEDQLLWEALLFEIFGTRQTSVVNAFVAQLSEIGPQVHQKRHAHTRGGWELAEPEMNQMLSIMLALKPQDEAQAAYAAQAVALHLSAMKLAQSTARTWGGDPKTATVLNKTVNAFGSALERMARLQGKAPVKTHNQNITVYYVDQRDQRQQAVIQGGGGYNGDQPYGADGSAAVQSPALPSPNQGGAAVPLPSGQGQAGVPHSRWRAWLGRTLRLAQR